MTSATVSCPICHPLKSSAAEPRHIVSGILPHVPWHFLIDDTALRKSSEFWIYVRH
jgi:hypothetical protein